jgi:serine/threonine protein kinase
MPGAIALDPKGLTPSNKVVRPCAPIAVSGHARAGAPFHKISLPIGAMGQPVELSVPWEDLTHDEYISNAPRVNIEGYAVPTLGGIPLLCKLGQGGMGAVYYGIHRGFAREVAVKVLPFHIAQMHPDSIDRFFREARLATKINSNHLVRVTDVDQQGNLAFLVMEYVCGKSAEKILTIGVQGGAVGLEETMVLDICIAGCKGLAAAHEANVIHRDVKPDNILVPLKKGSREYNFEAAKLADLGLARCEGMHKTVTMQDICMGSPGFMSPEQINDTRSVGKQADVFSFGATLYTLLCGVPPFTGETPMAILEATKRTQHKPVKNWRADVSNITSETIQICLAKNPNDRFADGVALLKALVACREALKPLPPELAQNALKLVSQEDSGRLLKAGRQPLPYVNHARKTDSDTQTLHIRLRQRSWALWIVSGIAVLALIALAVFAFAGRGRDRSRQDGAADNDVKTLDATKKSSDRQIIEGDQAHKNERDIFTQKLEATQAAAIEAGKKQSHAQDRARGFRTDVESEQGPAR